MLQRNPKIAAAICLELERLPSYSYPQRCAQAIRLYFASTWILFCPTTNSLYVSLSLFREAAFGSWWRGERSVSGQNCSDRFIPYYCRFASISLGLCVFVSSSLTLPLLRGISPQPFQSKIDDAQCLRAPFMLDRALDC